MQDSEQVDFLLQLGERLDTWTSPRDENDYLIPGVSLWNAKAVDYIPQPAKVIDVLAAQWVRVKDFTTQKPRGLLFNPAQRYFSNHRSDRNMILKAGRAGFTTFLWARGLLRTMTRQGYTALLVAHRQDQAVSYFTDVHYAFNHLGGRVGDALRRGVLRTTGAGAKKNVREIYFPAMNSRFFVETAGEFAPAEGESIQYLIADEMARWLKGNPKQVIATLLSHVTGEDTEAYLLSRPFGQSGEFYERYWEARRGQSDYSAFFFQWWWNPAQRVALEEEFKRTKEEARVAESYARWRKEEAPADCDLPWELDDEQLLWRRQNERELGDLFPQEFAENETACFLGSGNCPFRAESIASIVNDAAPVLETQKGGGESENGLLIWELPDPGCWYVLFVDPAGTLFTSRIAMELVNGRTMNQAAEWVGRTDAATAGAIVGDLANRYKRVIIAIEMNMGDVSGTIYRVLLREPFKFTEVSWPRIFRHQDSGGQWVDGWKTDPKNRPQMLEDLAKVLRDAPHVFHSRRLATELKTCVRVGDRIQAQKGMTDDLVMAMAGAHKVIAIEGEPEPEPVATCLDLSEPDEPSDENEERDEEEERGWVNVR